MTCCNTSLVRALLAMIAAVLAGGPALRGADEQPPRELSAEVVQAWKQAGAEVGWGGARGGEGWSRGKNIKESSNLFYQFCRLSFHREPKSTAGEVPAFSWSKWEPARFANLPMPAEPFGLELALKPVTDADLKELARFKELRKARPDLRINQ